MCYLDEMMHKLRRQSREADDLPLVAMIAMVEPQIATFPRVWVEREDTVAEDTVNANPVG